MRQTLQQRIASGLDAEPPRVRDEQARLVEDLARIMRETAAAAAASRPGGPSEEADAARHFTLPQILQPKPTIVRENRAPVANWLKGLPRDLLGLVRRAPGTIAIALACGLALAALWRSDLALPRPAETTAQSVKVQSVRTVAIEPAARAGQDDIGPAALIQHAERMIAAGNVPAARELLGRAALSGDTASRFALAETFDPIVLAAWGIKGVSADPSTARLLYAQALAAGDRRAERRLAALRTD